MLSAADLLIALGLVLLAVLAVWVRMDYAGWIALGKGGLPSNFWGWCITTRFRLMKKDPIDTQMYAGEMGGAADLATLSALPPRNGPRPQIGRWPIPHRQLSQFIGTDMRQQLNAVFDAAVVRHQQWVNFKLSFFEKHNLAITLCDASCGHAHARLSAGEIAHIHPTDGSMHMILSPSDSKRAIEAGWAERHSMSGVLPELPNTYLYVYPPRDALELKVVEQLLEASIAHMTARKS